MSTPLDGWEQTVYSRLSGATMDAIRLEMLQTIDDFSLRSTAWRETVYALDITNGDREVPVIVNGGSQAEVIGVLRVYYKQNRMTDYSHVPFENSAAAFSGYTCSSEDPSVIQLSNIPTESQAGVIDALVFCKPVDSTVFLPTVYTSQFYDYILSGVLGRMYSHQNRPYTNDALSLAHTRRYMHGVSSARDMAARGFTSNAQNWTFPRFGR